MGRRAGAAGILADWGAEVIKIEPPDGRPRPQVRADAGRRPAGEPGVRVGQPGQAGHRLGSVRPSAASRLAHRLVADADVFLTNLRPAALDRIGLGPDQVRRASGASVYAIITGYGLEGPTRAGGLRHRGVLGPVRHRRVPPGAPGGPLPVSAGGMGDHTVAMTGAAMVSAALSSGRGPGGGRWYPPPVRQGVYTIGFDVNIALMWGRTLGVGTVGRRCTARRSTTTRPATAAPSGSSASKGTVTGRPWPVRSGARVAHRRALCRRQGTRRQRRRADRPARRHLRHVPLERVGRRPSMLSRSCSGARSTPSTTSWRTSSSTRPGSVVEVPDEQGSLSMLATPVDFGGGASPRCRAPLIGEHTRQILAELGFDEETVASLLSDGSPSPRGSAR